MNFDFLFVLLYLMSKDRNVEFLLSVSCLLVLFPVRSNHCDLALYNISPSLFGEEEVLLLENIVFIFVLLERDREKSRGNREIGREVPEVVLPSPRVKHFPCLWGLGA